MDTALAATLGGGVGLVLGALAVGATRLSERARRTIPAAPPSQALPRGVSDVLSILRSIGIVLDSSDAVVNTSSSAVAYGLVRHGELVHQELRQLARQVRRDGVIREAELELTRGAGGGTTVMRARVAPLGSAHVLVLAEDHTHARRVEEIRRDFVANVSHELKTPVGGISLLSEAILDARDDPVAVARFGERIRVESDRLTRLVKEIVDLSRLQVQDTLHEPELVDIERVVSEAVDRGRVAAEVGAITFEVAVEPGLAVFGDGELLTTALANLVTNAVNYSDDETQVAVGARRVGELVEIAVRDQGHGIPASEQERVFERFYRVDAARSRATGGTGLGLAIVKHICANHGGEVTLWSVEGEGSTFTMRLPLAPSRVTAAQSPGAQSPGASSPNGQSSDAPTIEPTVTNTPTPTPLPTPLPTPTPNTSSAAPSPEAVPPTAAPGSEIGSERPPWLEAGRPPGTTSPGSQGRPEDGPPLHAPTPSVAAPGAHSRGDLSA